MESILNSVKKLLGLYPENKEFDIDILSHINSAIFVLNQIGIGKNGFTVFSEQETFSDFLEGHWVYDNIVKMYLYYKTRLGFDPPSNTTFMETQIAELEWRMLVEKEQEEQKEKEVEIS